MKRSPIKWGLFVLVIVLALTSCTQKSALPESTRVPTLLPAYPAPGDKSVNTNAGGQDAAVYPAPQAGKPPLPTPRTKMEATDPSTVVLASGKVQLVEFFAFW